MKIDLMEKERDFGPFGGQFVPETLMNALTELEEVYEASMKDEEFLKEYKYYCQPYTGRPSPDRKDLP